MAPSFAFTPTVHHLVYAHGNPKTKGIMPNTADFNWDPTANVATLSILAGGTTSRWLPMSRASTTDTTWAGTYTVGSSPFAVFLTDFTLNGTTITANVLRTPGGVTVFGPDSDTGTVVGIKK